jgi:hypothetical protein
VDNECSYGTDPSQPILICQPGGTEENHKIFVGIAVRSVDIQNFPSVKEVFA